MTRGRLRLRHFALDLSPLRYHPEYRAIFSGQIINNFGSQMTLVALPYQVYLLTRSPLALGLLAGVQLAGMVAFSLFGGTLADAIDRRKMLICTQIGLCIVSTTLALLAFSGLAQPWELYLLALAGIIITALDRPARQSLLPRLVSRERLTAAITINSVGLNTSRAVGPGVAGVVIASLGLDAAYAIDAASFMAALLALAYITPKPPIEQTRKAGIAAIREGLMYVKDTPLLLSIFAVDTDATIFGMSTALFPVLALDVFHAGARGLGFMVAAPSAGALLAALTSGWLRSLRHPGRGVISAVVVWGVAMTLFGLSPWLPLALVFLAIAGGADIISANLRQTMMQLTTPDALRGRVSALNQMVVYSGPRLGDIEATSVAAAFGAQLSVVSGGLACLVGLVFVLKFCPALAAYDARPESDVILSGSAAKDLASSPAG